MTDTIVPAWTDTKLLDPEANPLESMKHVRIYPSSTGRLTLQIRSRGRAFSKGTKSWNAISCANLGEAEARAIRDALSDWLTEGPTSTYAPSVKGPGA